MQIHSFTLRSYHQLANSLFFQEGKEQKVLNKILKGFLGPYCFSYSFPSNSCWNTLYNLKDFEFWLKCEKWPKINLKIYEMVEPGSKKLNSKYISLNFPVSLLAQASSLLSLSPSSKQGHICCFLTMLQSSCKSPSYSFSFNPHCNMMKQVLYFSDIFAGGRKMSQRVQVTCSFSHSY